MKILIQLLIPILALIHFKLKAQDPFPDSVYAIVYNDGYNMSIRARPKVRARAVDTCKSRDTVQILNYDGGEYLEVSRVGSGKKGYLYYDFFVSDKNGVDLINRVSEEKKQITRLHYVPLPQKDDVVRSPSRTPSYSPPASSYKTIQTGPRGGRYYINSKGNKTYIKKK